MKPNNTLLLLLVAILPLFPSASKALETKFEQAPESVLIEDEIEYFLDQQQYDSPYPVRFRTKKLDQYLKLKTCTVPLQTEFVNPAQNMGQTLIRVRCNKPFWNITLPVYISVYKDVLTLKHPLPQNSVILAEDTIKQKKDISMLKKGYFENTAQLKYYRTKRALAAHIVLTPGQLKKQLMVKSGQMVTIVNNSSLFNIKMAGKALTNGSIGDTVKIKNLSSGKIIQAQVLQPGLVQAYP